MPPTISVRVYVVSVEMAGAVPESSQSTVMAPTGIDAPAAGVVNLTSARAYDERAARRVGRWSRMVGVCGRVLGLNRYRRVYQSDRLGDLWFCVQLGVVLGGL